MDEFFGGCRAGDSVIAVGFTSVLGNSDGLFVVADSLGNPSSILAIGGPMAECLDAASGQYAVGYTNSWGSGASDVFLLRILDGSVVWALAFGGYTFDYGKDITQLNQDAIITGYTESYGNLGQTILLRVDHDGNLRWCKVFGGPGYDTGHRVGILGDTIIVVGRDGSNGGGILLFATDTLGNLLWARLLRATGYEYPLGLTVDGESIYVSGKHTNGGPAFLLKLSSDGTIIWSKYLGGNSSDGIWVLYPAAGQIIGLGYTSSFGFGRRDFLFASIDPWGYSCIARDANFTSVEISLPQKDTTPEQVSVNPQVVSLNNTFFEPTLSSAVWCEGISVEESQICPPGEAGLYDCTGRRLMSQPKKYGIYFKIDNHGRVGRFVVR
ncbi:MAG: hypothetical protein ACP5QG_01495 [candidate division WOR-3 bacterium]